ncbi:MAG: cyclic nucleotide-binding domain-containing protein, partial [Deltaproteobacteria bacterium]|nr:cyclic nucleotide-binding domain-containing protein [Deltaproteobacteria bacterium]
YLNPRDVILRQRLGDLLARMGRTDAAVRQFQHVAGHYASSGHLLKAIAICRVILEMDPNHLETQDTLAELYALQHETAPFQAKLPASMSGAVRKSTSSAETDMDLTQPVMPVANPAESELAGVFLEAPDKAASATQTPEPASEPVLLDYTAIGRAPLFSRLEKSAFVATLQKLKLRWVKGGEVIVSEGDAGDSMFVVVQGVMNVVRGTVHTQLSKPIALLGEGAFFGEMALVAGSPRLATVIAAKDGLLFEVTAGALVELAAAHPTVREVVHEFYRERLLANVLSSSPIFRPFDADKKRELMGHFSLESRPKGTLVLEQGKPGHGLFVLLRGQCEVFHRAPDGSEKPYPQMREGDVFGEISLLMNSPATANVRTATACEILELPGDQFRDLVMTHPAVKKMIERMVRERLQRTA